MCNTLNIKALELYCNIKKWNIELDTLNNNFTSLCSTLHFYTISRPNSLIFRQNFFEKSSNGKSWVKTKEGSCLENSTLPVYAHRIFLYVLVLSSRQLFFVILYIPRLCPGLLSLCSVLASSQSYLQPKTYNHQRA